MTLTDESIRNGDWLQTFTGKRFYPLDPRVDDIHYRDIAHALARICRYGGHAYSYYTVAEHCVLLSHAVPEEWALAALLHDAGEAYIGDMVRPLKRYMDLFRSLEDEILEVIGEKYGVSLNPLPTVVKAFDDRILVNEKPFVLPGVERWALEDVFEPIPDIKIQGWLPAQAEQEYASRLLELCPAAFE